jgi:uncharacterized membrane protein YedE/YeeE
MPEFEPFLVRTLLGFVLGAALGYAGRRGRFCTVGAIEDAIYGNDTRRLRGWVIAIAVAIAGTQILQSGFDLDLSRSIYTGPRLEWGGALIGGVLFGLGMALVGTCGFGTLLRLGGGDLRSLMVFLVIAISAMMTLRGPLGLLRIQLIEPLSFELPGRVSQRLPDVMGLGSGAATALAFMIAGVLALAAGSQLKFLRSGRYLATGTIVGVIIVLGWWATGIAGYDSFDTRRVESFSFVAPLGETMLYGMLASGLKPDFPVGAVFGVLTGAFTAAIMSGQFRWEASDDAREMGRHLLGAVLMGFGGVTALGCTVGQGITGLSTLSIGSVLAILSILVGARIGLYWLVERIGTGQRSCA